MFSSQVAACVWTHRSIDDRSSDERFLRERPIFAFAHTLTHARRQIHMFQRFSGFVMTLIDLQLHFAFVGLTYIIIGGGFCFESTESLSQQCDGGWHSGCLLSGNCARRLVVEYSSGTITTAVSSVWGANTQQTGVSNRGSTGRYWLVSRGIDRAN